MMDEIKIKDDSLVTALEVTPVSSIAFRIKDFTFTLEHEGQIKVNGKLIEEDKQLVDAFRNFLKDTGYYL